MQPTPPNRTGARKRLSRSGTRRLGDDYQDVVALDLIVDWLGANDRFTWLKLEADDALHLDDVTAERGDGTLLYRQVKYSTDPTKPGDPWTWDVLIDRDERAGKGGKKSLVQKWAVSLEALTARSPGVDAAVVSNRAAGRGLRESLRPDGTVDFDSLDAPAREAITAQLGGEPRARDFLARFRFDLGNPGLRELEAGCRRRFRRLGGTELGWSSLKEAVALWVAHRDEPRDGGVALLEDIHQAARWHDLKSIPQRFPIPDDFVLPSEGFHVGLVEDLLRGAGTCRVLSGTPGSGKSTYASFLYRALEGMGVPVLRHHYHLPSIEITGYQRADHLVAAESLMHDLKAHHAPALGALAARNPAASPEELREWLVAAGDSYAKDGDRLVVILDGLDHVWRERRSASDLERLLGPLLPAPPGVVFLLVTQPVDDGRLPACLLTHASREGWLKIPLFDEQATASWATAALQTERGDEAAAGAERPGNPMPFASALHRLSGGHPLHLRYSLRAVLERGLPRNAASLAALPGCPSEDIASYYRSLWSALGEPAREILHLIACSSFAWPEGGLPDCLEPSGRPAHETLQALREVRHLLSDGGFGAAPYHSSLLVFVRGQAEHGPRRARLVPFVLRWLKERAPEYWRWAYAWALDADTGSPEPLIGGLTRPWLVDSLARCRPGGVVSELISRGLWHAAGRGDLRSFVRIALLCDYAIDVFENRAELASSLLRPLLESDPGSLPAERLYAELASQRDIAVVSLAVHAARIGDARRVGEAFDLLRQRAGDPEARRRRSLTSWDAEAATALAVGVLEGGLGVEGIVRVARRNREGDRSENVLAICAAHLRRYDDGAQLRRLLGTGIEQISLGEDAGLRRGELGPVLREGVLHALERGWDLPGSTDPVADDPLVQIYAFLRELPGFLPPEVLFPARDLPERFADPYTERSRRLEEVFRGVFFSLLANHLWGRAARNLFWIGDDDTWAGRFLGELDRVAAEAAEHLKARRSRPHRWLFEQVARLPRPEFRGNENIDEYQVSVSGVRAVMALGFDLTILFGAAGAAPRIDAEDVRSIRGSAYCVFDDWLALYAESRRAWMEGPTWTSLAAEVERALGASITPFEDRARKYSLLATVASLHGARDESLRLVRDAAENLVAHGNHKDLLFHDVLESVDALGRALRRERRAPCGPPHPRAWLEALAPAIVRVGDFTDGDETGHLPGDLSRLLGEHAPDLLPGYYTWLAAEEEYPEAIQAFEHFLRTAGLENPVAGAIATTAIERDSRAVLAERAEGGDRHARTALDSIEGYCGPPSEPKQAPEGSSGPGPDRGESNTPLPPPSDFPPAEVEAYFGAIRGRYRDRGLAVASWAEHWSREGRGREALEALERLDARGEPLWEYDAAYALAKGLGERERAFGWLVRAQREEHGWSRFYGPEEPAARRWEEVRRSYRDRRLDFLRESAWRFGRVAAPGGEPWRGMAFGHGGFLRLVRYLLALGEEDSAIAVVDETVRAALEYVSPQRFPGPPWLGAGPAQAPEDGRLLDLLLARLSWPSAPVRERACTALASLLAHPASGAAVRQRLLGWIDAQELEDLAAVGLLALWKAGADGLGTPSIRAEAAAALRRPSLLSAAILGDAAGVSSPMHPPHSGDAPDTLVVHPFFAKHAKNFQPPLFWERAARVERVGTLGFRRQWAFEWDRLRSRLGVALSTSPLDFFCHESSHKEPHRAVDLPLGDVFASFYLRALGWAVATGRMPAAGGSYLAAEICPVDLELWKLAPRRRPDWWPDFSVLPDAVNAVPARVVGHLEALRHADRRGAAPWGREWMLAQASGRVADGEAVYDAELVAFLQRCDGPGRPSPEEVFSWALHREVLGGDGPAQKDGDFALRGDLRAVDPAEALRPLGDWRVLPVAGSTWGRYPVRWQWWRLHRPAWLPFLYTGGPARFDVGDDALRVRRGDETIGRWQDWTHGFGETLDYVLTPAAGESLLVKRELFEGLADRFGMRLAWAIRLTCYDRKDVYERYKEHLFHQVLGTSSILLPSMGD